MIAVWVVIMVLRLTSRDGLGSFGGTMLMVWMKMQNQTY